MFKDPFITVFYENIRFWSMWPESKRTLSILVHSIEKILTITLKNKRKKRL